MRLESIQDDNHSAKLASLYGFVSSDPFYTRRTEERGQDAAEEEHISFQRLWAMGYGLSSLVTSSLHGQATISGVPLKDLPIRLSWTSHTVRPRHPPNFASLCEGDQLA